jgi:outer membrane receptor protein involved in Fe transport
LEFSAHPDWAVQGTWVRLYRPPNLPDLNEASNRSELITLEDPKASSGTTSALVWSGGNRYLRPETGSSANVGVTFTPQGFEGASVALTYFHTTVSNRIEDLPAVPPSALTDAQYANWVLQAVSAPLRDQICTDSHFNGVLDECLSAPIGAIVDNRLHSVANLVTDGVDGASRYALNTRLGQLTFALDGTYVLHYREADTPASPWVELRDTAHNPVALRARGSIGWERQDVWASLAANYQGHSMNTDIAAQPRIGSWTTWDLVVGYRIWGSEPTAGREAQIVLSGQNVLNQHPPSLDNPVERVSYDEENGDLLGRRVSLALKVRW